MAVVEGSAVGGGMILAAACDLRLCTPEARFGMPIARTVGHGLSVANHARLVAHLGPGISRNVAHSQPQLPICCVDETQRTGCHTREPFFVRSTRIDALAGHAAVR